VAALRAVGRELQIELTREAGGAVDDQGAARLRPLAQEARQRTMVARPERDRLRTHSACSVISLVSASIAGRRAVLLRHNAPIWRCGAGFANGRSTTPRALR